MCMRVEGGGGGGAVLYKWAAGERQVRRGKKQKEGKDKKTEGFPNDT